MPIEILAARLQALDHPEDARRELQQLLGTASTSGLSHWEVVANLAHAPLFGILALLLALALPRAERGWPALLAGRVVLVVSHARGSLSDGPAESLRGPCGPGKFESGDSENECRTG